MIKKVLYILILLLLVTFSRVYSFDINGFKSSMSYEEVKKEVDNRNFDKVYIKGNQIIANSIYRGSFICYIFNFCKGKLVQYSYDIKPSMKSFIIIYGKFLKKYGEPFHSKTDVSVLPYGESYQLSYIWKNGLDAIELSYNVFPTNNQIQVTYEVSNECFKTWHKIMR